MIWEKTDQSIKGTTEDKSDVETRLEDPLIAEAGLLVSYYQEQNDPVNLAKEIWGRPRSGIWPIRSC